MEKELSKIGNQTTCPVAIIIENGKVLMGLRHYGPGDWKEISVWTVPGGRCEINETVEGSLRREVEEETGIYNLEISKYLGEASGAKSGDRVPMFVCRTKQREKLVEPKKFSEWRWFGPDEFPNDFINQNVSNAIRKYLVNNS